MENYATWSKVLFIVDDIWQMWSFEYKVHNLQIDKYLLVFFKLLSLEKFFWEIIYHMNWV